MSCMIRKSLSKLPNFLTVDDLVEIGLYPSHGSFAGAQHRGHAPDGVRVGTRLIFHREAVEMKGFSFRNLKYMVQFAKEYPDSPIGQQPVAQIPWGHNLTLESRLTSLNKGISRLTSLR